MVGLSSQVSSTERLLLHVYKGDFQFMTLVDFATVKMDNLARQ